MKESLKQELSTRMESAIKNLDNEFKGLRTGRASVNLLDPVQVESYGNRVSITQVATISTPDPRTISVQVWDKSNTKAVEKAIIEANLGLNPAADGQLLRIPIPPLNEERRKELVKLAYKYAENTKIALRNIRKNGMDNLKKLEKEGEISKDEHKNLADEIQKLTDNFAGIVDNRAKQKEQEILTL